METFNAWLNRWALYFALLAAWTAMLGSLYFSQVMGFVPCDLCWFQRILMYPLSLVLAGGLILRDRHLPKLVLPLSVLGMLVSTYHYMLEKTDWFDAVQVCRSGVSCTTLWINWYGFITIPFLALTAFTIITIASVIALMAGEPDEESRPILGHAWLPVALFVGGVLVVFGILFSQGWDRTAEARDLAARMEQGTSAGSMSTAEDVGEDAITAAGHALFTQACAACHGQSAEGVPNLGNNLQASDFIRGLTDTELLQFIRNGRDLTSPENTSGLVMPQSGGRPDLTDAQMNDIILFLRSKQ
jgi:disulfide bond formation protein DsbB/mono/diheme cytochrome c family protein